MKRTFTFVLLVLLILSRLTATAQNKPGAGSTSERKLTPEQRQELETALKLAKSPEEIKFLQKALELNVPLVINSSDGGMVLDRFENENCPIYVTGQNVSGGKLIKSRFLHKLGGLGFDLGGANIPMGIWEPGGIRLRHECLRDRVRKIDTEIGQSNDLNHGTHVAGTMISSGEGESNDASRSRGMAYKGSLRCFNSLNDIYEVNEQASTNSLLISNHSYANNAGWEFTDAYNNGTGPKRWVWYGKADANLDYKFGYYSAKAREYDKVAYENPKLLICVPAGNGRINPGPQKQNELRYICKPNGGFEILINSGEKRNTTIGIYDNIKGDNSGKNVLTIGATQNHDEYTGPASIKSAPFSSCGPTDDGRIKPDLVAKGMIVHSLSGEGNNEYRLSDGTSMATPMVSGTAALLQELYKKHNNGVTMNASTLKALLIHTADECGRALGPDYEFGYGLVNAQKAANTIIGKGLNSYIIEGKLLNGKKDKIKIQFVNHNNLLGLKATLVWNDPPGTADNPPVLNSQNKKLVNDLDLRMELPTGQIVFPWVLNPLQPNNPALKADNTRDNVEVVLNEIPVNGDITVEVSHKGNIGDGQSYSLIITGFGLRMVSVNPQIVLEFPPESIIENVKFTAIDNTTTDPNIYANFSNLVADVCSENVYKLSVRVKDLNPSHNYKKTVKVWIDWNGNGSFNDPGELVMKTDQFIVGNNNNTLSSDITIPPFYGQEQSRLVVMRVITRVSYNIHETFNNAMNETKPNGEELINGEIEDYTVRINNKNHTTTVNSALAQDLEGVHSNLILANNGKAKVGNTLEVRCKCEVQTGGTLRIETNPLKGSADFELQEGGTLIIRKNEGIAPDASSGALQITGKRNISSKAYFEYEVTTGVTGLGFPETVARLTVSTTNFPNKLTLSKNLRVLDQLTIKTGTLDLNGKSLVLNAGENKTARLDVMCADCKIIGNTFTQEQYVPGNTPAWYILASPIKDRTLSHWSASVPITGIPGAGGGGKNVMFYYEPNTPIANAIQHGYYYPGHVNDATPVGQGMVVYLYKKFFDDGAKMRLTGEPHYLPLPGTFNFPITFTPATGFGGGGFNLVGNPFPCEIDWNSAQGWTKTNVSGAIWVWNKNKYASWVNGVGTNGGSNLIPAMQGFFMRATAANPVLACTEAVKAPNKATSPAFMRTAVEENLVRISLWNQLEEKDECVLRIEPGTTPGLDPDFDAQKFMNPEYNIALKPQPDLYLAISTQSMPIGSPDTIPLVISTPQGAMATLKVQQVPPSLAGKLYIWDKIANTLLPIENNFTLLIPTGSAPNQERYALIVLPETVTANKIAISQEPNMLVYPNPAQKQVYMQIQHTKATRVEISWYDAVGRQIHRESLHFAQPGQPLELVRPTMTKGVYRLKAELNDDKNTVLSRWVAFE